MIKRIALKFLCCVFQLTRVLIHHNYSYSTILPAQFLKSPYEAIPLLEMYLNITKMSTKNTFDPSTVYLYLCQINARFRLIEENLYLLNTTSPVIFIIHGWGESASKPWYQSLIEAYHQLGNFNIIAVDWSLPSQTLYSTACFNTRLVGNIVGDFIIKLNAEYDVPFGSVHVIGHSLGGHTAGFAGKRVRDKKGMNIGRITALDPAGPLFENKASDQRLSAEDADVVDVIHTDAGYFGMKEPCGTIDFYPNGGTSLQPGCNVVQYPLKVFDIGYIMHE